VIFCSPVSAVFIKELPGGRRGKLVVVFRFSERETFFVTLSNANEDVTIVVFVTLKSVQCMHFEEASGVWEASGCSVVNSTDTTVCRCDRVAQFGVSEMPIYTTLSFQRVPVCRVLICCSPS